MHEKFQLRERSFIVTKSENVMTHEEETYSVCLQHHNPHIILYFQFNNTNTVFRDANTVFHDNIKLVS